MTGVFIAGATNYNTVMDTQNFATDGSSLFFTGVVYDETRVNGDEADGTFATLARVWPA